MTTTREAELEQALMAARPRIVDMARSWEAEAQLLVKIDAALALSTPAIEPQGSFARETLNDVRQATLKFDIDKMLTQIEEHNAAWDELRASEAAAVARADQARDAALVEAAGTLEDQALDAEGQAKRFRGGSDPWADRTARSRALRNSADTILALRDKPAETAPQPALCSTSEPQTARAVTVQEADDIDARMKALGMIPLSEMLNSHGPMEKWMQHAHVHTFPEFVEWVSMKQREYMSMRMRYEIGDKDKGDDMFEWVFAHAAVFDGIATQLRAIAGGGDE